MRIIVLFICLLALGVKGLGQELTIVSWNLKDFGQSRDNGEISMIASELVDADIVAIQEVVAKHPGGAKAVARLSDELNRRGAQWDYRISDPTQSSSPYKSERYAILWKTAQVRLSGSPVLLSDLAHIVEREPHISQFRFNNKEIVIVNYHACTHTKTYPERAEIKAITDYISKIGSNVIWAGDMNLVITDGAFDRAKEFGFQSVLHGEKTSLKKSCKDGSYLSRAEDNILFRFRDLALKEFILVDFIKKGECTDVSWKRNSYSDHLGIGMKIR